MLLIICRLPVLLHKHPHELLDSVVKERFDQGFRLNRGRAFYSSPSYCQAVFRKSLFYSTACRFRSVQLLVSGRRILQRSIPLSTTSSSASSRTDRSTDRTLTTAPSARRILLESAADATSLLLNPLIIKEFFIQAAPEVARIIEPFEQPSTLC